MNSKINIENRIPVWEKLSLFYLDTELDYYDYRQISLTILQSPFSLDEAKIINRREVFPILYVNFLSIAGEWSGFDIDWLSEKIIKRSRKRNVFSKFTLSITHLLFKGMYMSHWKEVEKAITEMRSHPDSYITACRALANEGIEPFDFPRFDSELIQKLNEIAMGYCDRGEQKVFIEYLTDRNDFIHMWTGYLILELFPLNNRELISIYGDSYALKENCLGQMELDLVYLKKETSRENARKWLFAKKGD